ncbi:RNA polymerase sigma factor [Catenuloplanes indicus]|uniref:RNA polymerase sigma factor (Sigma-70 family) n=1 Tax=Catenuloplanes indicus TaxID=137267 RepID=A0AAE3W096_9ACTN|nr:sigma-70 family RNA polymerase sigma factor [Catenuloplanes indicus]MDQ0366950.1 RNA polymerase sigma factor (sigma-70 family) [Catenuloplanes indicus]
MNRNDVAVIRADQTEFYRANVSRLLQYAYVRCGDRQWAEDLVHETFVRLFRAWSTERAAVADRRGYAARTLLNCFRDDLRRRSARPPTDLVADHEDRPSSVPVAEGEVDVADQVRAAVRGLAPQQREVIYHFYYEDLSLAETARVMGIGPASVHNYHSLAKKRLRTELAHLAPPAKERRNER